MRTSPEPPAAPAACWRRFLGARRKRPATNLAQPRTAVAPTATVLFTFLAKPPSGAFKSSLDAMKREHGHLNLVRETL